MKLHPGFLTIRVLKTCLVPKLTVVERQRVDKNADRFEFVGISSATRFSAKFNLRLPADRRCPG